MRRSSVLLLRLPPDEEAEGYAGLLHRYHSRSNSEKEHFAHDYAERVRKHLIAIGAIPFDRELDRDRILLDGLRLQDFIFEATSL